MDYILAASKELESFLLNHRSDVSVSTLNDLISSQIGFKDYSDYLSKNKSEIIFTWKDMLDPDFLNQTKMLLTSEFGLPSGIADITDYIISNSVMGNVPLKLKPSMLLSQDFNLCNQQFSGMRVKRQFLDEIIIPVIKETSSDFVYSLSEFNSLISLDGFYWLVKQTESASNYVSSMNKKYFNGRYVFSEAQMSSDDELLIKWFHMLHPYNVVNNVFYFVVDNFL